jgi:hypothetical protein
MSTLKIVKYPLEQAERLAFFGWVWEPGQTANVSVATKADKAQVDLSLWAIGGMDPEMEQHRNIIRTFFLRCWRQRLYLEAMYWLKTSGRVTYSQDVEPLHDALERAVQANWWPRIDGIRLLFWRCPPCWRREARDGAIAFHKSYPPPCLKARSPPIKEEWICALDEEKIVKLINWRYLEDAKERCRNTIPRHPVPKGTDDIHVVWDCTNNGINPTIYTPYFWLPMIATLCRRILANNEQGDFDIEEEFHNYVLHKYERQFHGVLIPKLVCDTHPLAMPLMRFTVPPFGWTSSPYFTSRMLARIIELSKGPRHDTMSSFH